MGRFALQKALDKKGCTQYKLAKILKVSAGEVFRWCQPSYNPTLKTMLRIAEVLDVGIEELVNKKK